MGKNATLDLVGKVPPHSERAERGALGSVFIRPASLDDLTDLGVDDFFFPVHREIFEVMRDVAAAGRPVEILAVADELRARGRLQRLDGGEAFLVSLANDTPTAENVRHYARVIAAKATLRRAIATCLEAVSVAYGGPTDVEAFLNDLRGSVAGLELRGDDGPRRIGEVLVDVTERIERRASAPEDFLVPTGIASVDRKVGGLRAKHLIIVAARPGGGKTAWAVNTVAVAAARAGVPTLVFSLEMSRDELIERAMANAAKVNGHAIGLGRLTGPEWVRLTGAMGKLYEIPLWVDERVLRTQQICAEARRWRARHAPEGRALVIVDYLGLVEADKDERTREREVAKITRAMKKLAKQLGCPVVLCSQLNRNMVGKDGKMRAPNLTDLRESGAVEQDADVVVFPWWDSAPPAVGRHPAKLIFGKYRGGHPGTIQVDWLPEYTVFEEREDHEPDPQEDLRW